MSGRTWCERSPPTSRARAVAATAAPACSMSHSPGVPSRCARASAPRISSAVIVGRAACARHRSASSSRSAEAAKMTSSSAGSGIPVVGSTIGARKSPKGGSRVVLMVWTMVGALPRRHASRGGRPAAAPPWPPRCAPSRAHRWRPAGTPRRLPPGSRSCATMRPRSQRVVCSKAGRLTGAVRGGAPSAAGTPPWLGTRDRAGLAETRPALAHQRLTGQASQAGATGRQSVAPSSMDACVQVAGSWRATSRSASTCSWEALSDRPASRPTTLRTLVSTAATGCPKARAATARAV